MWQLTWWKVFSYVFFSFLLGSLTLWQIILQKTTGDLRISRLFMSEHFSRWWNFKYFYFDPDPWGKIHSHFDEHIFQRLVQPPTNFPWVFQAFLNYCWCFRSEIQPKKKHVFFAGPPVLNHPLLNYILCFGGLCHGKHVYIHFISFHF